MYDREAQNMVREMDMRLRQQGMDFDTYMKYTGMDANAVLEMYKPEAQRRVKMRLALEKIAELEKIEPTEEEINADMVDRTNVPNPHQGTIRYGQLDEKALLKRIREDFDSVQLPRKCRIRRTLAVTHENEYPGRVIAMGDYVSECESRDSVKLQ
jgi:hypothetical protein